MTNTTSQSDPDQGRINRSKNVVVIVFLVLLIVVFVLLGLVTVRQQFWMIRNRQAVISSYELSVQLDRLFMLLQEAEGADQAYLLTGKSNYLDSFNKIVTDLDGTFDNLARRFNGNEEAGSELGRLRQFYVQEISQLRKLALERQKSGRPLAAALATSAIDDSLKANIRALPLTMKEEQRLFRLGATQDLQRQTETFSSELLTLITVALLALIGSATYAAAQLRAKDKAIALVRQSASETAATQVKLAAILSSMDEGLYLLDENARLSYMNPACESMLGYKLEEIMGAEMHALMHHTLPDGTVRPASECPLINVMASGVTHREQEDFFVCKDGSFLPVHYISSPLVSDGKITGAVLAFFDISDRKLDELRLRAQQEVTSILAEGLELDQSVSQIVRLLCSYFDWQIGALWLVTGYSLQLRTFVQADEKSGLDQETVDQFAAASKASAFKVGEGLPGRVWESLKPAWMEDIIQDPDFPRRQFAADVNLRGAFALPIMAGNDFLGVIEFFSCASRERSDDQIDTFMTICSQLGQFVQRLKAYELLAASEDRYSLALSGSMDGVWDWNIETDEVFFSERWKELLGFSADDPDFDPHKVIFLIHPEDREEVQKAFRDHIKGLTPVYNASFRIKNKAGEYRWFSGRGRAVRNSSGRAVRIAGSNRDITQEIEAAEKLHQSERKFHAIFDKTFEFIGLLSPDGTLLDANQAALDFVQVERSDVVGKPFWQSPWFAPDDYERLKNAIAQAALGQFDRFEVQHKKADEIITVDFSLQPVFDETGDVVLIIPEGRDITQLKLTEARLKESETLFRQLAENIREIFWIASADSSKFFYVSPAYEEITGRHPSVVENDPKIFFDVLEPDDRARAFRDFKEFLNTRISKEGEYRVIRPDGEVRWLAAKVFPIFNEDGELVRVCGVARDINEKKEAERRVSEFYSTVSHELRSPLTSIRGSLGLIEGGVVGEVSDQVKTFITIARSESDRLIRLINNILDLRKIEAGKLELKLDELSVQDLIDTTIGALLGMAAVNRIELISLSRDEYELFADRDLISQVLTNVISNAIKFSPDGGKVTVGLTPDEPGFLCFWVQDEGPGIPASQIHKLFGKFQQLDSSDTRSKGGTGLGLAISKAIVEQHGGSIGVESEEGEGAKFWFKLPLYVPDAQLPKRALIYSCDGALSTHLSIVAQLDSIVTVTSNDLNESIRFLREEHFDVLILDVGSNPSTAIDLLATTTTLNRCLPVVVVSGATVDKNAYGDALILDGVVDALDSVTFAKTVTDCIARCQDKSPKILIVEDDPATRAVVRQQIGELGIHCMEAHDGEHALELMRDQMPDLIVLDVGLPKVDGFDLIATLRREAKNVPVIIYTARDLSRDDKDALSLGLTRYLTKSQNSAHDLLAAVRELLSGIVAGKSQ